MKSCYKCKQEKPLSEFRQYKSGKNKGNYYSYCGECSSEYHKERRLKEPWYGTLISIKLRCNNTKRNWYKRGIKCLITLEELKYLWFRDKAWLLERPSVDRIDNDGHYILDNCRYIELVENARLGNLRKGKILR